MAHVKYDNEIDVSPIYKEMKVIITQNRDKKNGVVNGQTATVLYWHRKTIILKLTNKNIVAIHQVTEKDQEGNKRVVYPIVPAYATTICKIQGQTLNKTIVWLDCDLVPEGTAYVALSRLRKLEDLHFMVQGNANQFKPVAMLNE